MRGPAAEKRGEATAMGEPDTADDRERIEALSRGLAAIEAFADFAHPLTITDMAEHMGIPKATARRILRTLVQLGYAEFDGRRFDLTPQILRLGFAYLSSRPLGRIAQEVVDRVRAVSDASVSLAVLDGDEIVMTARAQAEQLMPVRMDIGSRLPAFCTSMGQALLAYSPEETVERALSSDQVRNYTVHTETDPEKLRRKLKLTAERGYALVDQEAAYWLGSIAVPIFDSENNLLAAMSISTHTSAVSASDMPDRYLDFLKAAQDEFRNRIPGLKGGK